MDKHLHQKVFGGLQKVIRYTTNLTAHIEMK